MKDGSPRDTVDGRNPHHLGCVKPCNNGDKLPYQLVSRISSTNSITSMRKNIITSTLRLEGAGKGGCHGHFFKCRFGLCLYVGEYNQLHCNGSSIQNPWHMCFYRGEGGEKWIVDTRCNVSCGRSAEPTGRHFSHTSCKRNEGGAGFVKDGWTWHHDHIRVC